MQTALVHRDAMSGPMDTPRSLVPAHGEGVALDPPSPFPSLSQHPATRLYFTTPQAAQMGREMGGISRAVCLQNRALASHSTRTLGSVSRSFSAGREAGGLQGCLSTGACQHEV